MTETTPSGPAMWGQDARYTARQDRLALTALTGGRTGIVRAAALTPGDGLAVTVEAGWLAVADARDGTVMAIGSDEPVTVDVSPPAGGGGFAVFAWLAVDDGRWVITQAAPEEAAASPGIVLADADAPAGAVQASEIAFTPRPETLTLGPPGPAGPQGETGPQGPPAPPYRAGSATVFTEVNAYPTNRPLTIAWTCDKTRETPGAQWVLRAWGSGGLPAAGARTTLVMTAQTEGVGLPMLTFNTSRLTGPATWFYWEAEARYAVTADGVYGELYARGSLQVYSGDEPGDTLSAVATLNSAINFSADRFMRINHRWSGPNTAQSVHCYGSAFDYIPPAEPGGFGTAAAALHGGTTPPQAQTGDPP